MNADVKSVETDALQIAYVEYGPDSGWPVILSHGFPYDVHAFDDAAAILGRSGARVIVPYTRGFGPTRFISDDVMRSGQQAARGAGDKCARSEFQGTRSSLRRTSPGSPSRRTARQPISASSG